MKNAKKKLYERNGSDISYHPTSTQEKRAILFFITFYVLSLVCPLSRFVLLYCTQFATIYFAKQLCFCLR